MAETRSNASTARRRRLFFIIVGAAVRDHRWCCLTHGYLRAQAGRAIRFIAWSS